jgi:hypothetical protein
MHREKPVVGYSPTGLNRQNNFDFRSFVQPSNWETNYEKAVDSLFAQRLYLFDGKRLGR